MTKILKEWEVLTNSLASEFILKYFGGELITWFKGNIKGEIIMDDKIIDLDSQRPHKTSCVICLACFKDWQAVYLANTEINKLECPNCGKSGAVEFNIINARKIILKLSKNLKND